MIKGRLLKNRSLNTFLKYSIRHKTLLITTVLLSFLASGLSALPAWLIKYLVDDVLISKNVKMLVIVISGLIVSTILKGVASYFTDVKSAFVTETIKREIKIDVFKHLQNLPISYYKKNKLGDIMARLSGDASSLGKIGFLIFDVLKEVTTAIVLLVRLFQVNWLLSIISLTALPAVMNLIKKYTKKIRKAGRKRQDIAGELIAYTQEGLSGINIVKAFSAEEKAIKNYNTLNMKEFDASMRSKKIRAKVSPINEVITTLMVSLVAGYGCYLVVVKNTMSPGDLISFVTALGLLQSPIKNMIKRNNELQEMLPSADRVLEILDADTEIDHHGIKEEMSGNISEVKFEHVKFYYDDKSEAAVKDFNLFVKPGEVVALVGKSGSGKTTLVNLIPRFYETSEGTIKVNGIDIKNYSLKEYRKNIGIVPQETFLFSGTIASNIAYGREKSTMEEIVEAAKMANAYDFIMEFEKGFDTEVGERGAMISGGQKQRIAIARALIQDPEIMILDEATSALDTESERLVQDALDKLMEGRTTFVIAHRLSTIINADKIVVMEKGEIKEIGCHNELLEQGGIYKKLYETQFGETA
ncbi:ABC transporter ATP-binding protein [Ilyobacter polytropus]|uniref:ABC transporter related protein n=1 Tax=Ilyobacter polytropus (strain ATCC 51220 / DSM 2926 / LMG 16218 / CuHBu1) TaxID=572544 RepID=E3H7J5_ILYPC|nr:ABC transporter ATP-binding protein [Ilyobacter polytropus]ADO82891.1 ABC transporter related protein [Ilyobacter polytropus DSM 2926]